MNNKDALVKFNKLSKEQQKRFLEKVKEKKKEQYSIDEVDRNGKLYASPAQRALWLENSIKGDSKKYNMSSAYKISGNLDVSIFKSAFQLIINRHESLRTTFEENDGEVFQVIHKQIGFKVEEYELSNKDGYEKDELLNQKIKEVSQFVFNLSEGPLIRVALIKYSLNEYIFVLNVHHIVFDGWSKGLLLKELRKIYQYCKDVGDLDVAISELISLNKSLLPDLPIHYADYSNWQIKKRKIDEQVEFWRRNLKGAPSMLNLPLDYPRRPSASDSGKVERVRLGRELSDKIAAAAKHYQATPYMVVLSAFSMLLSRYSGQRDIVIGSPVDNRPSDDVKNIVGYFLNTCAHRINIDEDKSFSQLVEHVKSVCIKSYENQDAPWDEIVKAVNPLRSASYTPIFQAMMVFQNPTSHEFSLPGVDIEKIGSGTSTTKYDIYFTLADKKEGLEGWLTYNDSLFKSSSIKRLINNLRILLNALINDSQSPLSKHNFLGGEELNKLMSVEGDSMTLPGDRVDDIFENRASESPDKVALIYKDEELSYRLIDEHSNYLANLLASSNVNAGEIVGIAIDRSPSMVCAILAVMKVGAIYLPIDTNQPNERIVSMLTDAKPTAVLTDSSSYHVFDGIDECDILCLRNNYDKHRDTELLCKQRDKSDIAYVMYTSGSTGNPKAIQGTHKGIINRISWMEKNYPYKENEVLCHKTASTFVDSIAELWGPLLYERPVVIYPQTSYFDVIDFVDFISSHKVSRLVLVPSLLRSILDYYPDLRHKAQSLRVVMTSGEAMAVDLAGQFIEALPNVLLLNIYGSTEVSADALCAEVNSTHVERGEIPIGRPISNTCAYILDDSLNICPVGVQGDLYIGGHGLANGYLNDLSLTEKSFKTLTISEGYTVRLFNTRDKAKLLDDGNIYYLGRTDHQVKIRGIRINLLEIESVISRMDGVYTSVCTLKKDKDGEYDQLVAYVVMDEESNSGVEEVKSHIKSVLPTYMHPQHIVKMDDIPLNSNGKVDRNRLPEIDIASYDNEIAAPGTEYEKAVYEMFREVLNIDNFCITTSFFELGGHSLAATKIISKVRDAYQLEIAARDVFENLNVRSLASFIQDLVYMRQHQEVQEIDFEDGWETTEF